MSLSKSQSSMSRVFRVIYFSLGYVEGQWIKLEVSWGGNYPWGNFPRM